MPGMFSPPSISTETASKPPWHASWHVRDARAVMFVDITKPRWWGKAFPAFPAHAHPHFIISSKKVHLASLGHTVLIQRPYATNIFVCKLYHQWFNNDPSSALMLAICWLDHIEQLPWNCNQNADITIHENAFVVCKMAAILSAFAALINIGYLKVIMRGQHSTQIYVNHSYEHGRCIYNAVQIDTQI